MADGDHVMGQDCLAYYNSATNASPTWVAISQISGVSVDDGGAAAALDTRESPNFMLYGAGKVDLSITLENYLHVKGADTVFTALQGMGRHLSTAVAPKQIAIMDQAIATTGAKGWKAFCILDSMPQTQASNEGVTYNLNLKTTRALESSSIVLPSWFVVSS